MINTFQFLFGAMILGGLIMILNGRYDIIFDQFYEAVTILVS